MTYRAILLFKILALSFFVIVKKTKNKTKKTPKRQKQKTSLKQTTLYIKLCLYLGYFLGIDDQEWDHEARRSEHFFFLSS